MKEIPLTQGKVALVDDEDFERLSKFKWYFNNGYASRQKRQNGKRFRIYLHRSVIDVPDGMCIDHIDGNRLNNCKNNLRICTKNQNGKNVKKCKGKSKYKGVCARKDKWRSVIYINGKSVELGCFDSEEEAAIQYNKAALFFFGEFASLNKMEGF